MKIGDIEVAEEFIARLCARWKIRSLYIFGSARTGRLRPDSDIDLLAEFDENERWSLLDLARAELEFARLLGRQVDLVDRRSLERSANDIRRAGILSSTELLYAA